MNVSSLRILRLFLWGILAVMLLTIGTMFLLRATLMERRELAQGPVSTERDLKPIGNIPEFKLTDQDGEPFDSTWLRGHVSVVDFFFTKCDGICPVLQGNMKKVQDAFADSAPVRLLSISVDPGSDTPAVLRKMAIDIGADTETWAWTVGPKADTAAIAKGFKLMGTEVPGEILHSNRFVLVDGYGRIRGYYTGTEDEEVAALIEDIKRLLGE